MAKPLILEERRRMACLQAAWEVDAIARALPGMVNRDEHFGHLQVRAMAGRLLRLSSVIIFGLDDGVVDTERLEHIISLDGGQG